MDSSTNMMATPAAAQDSGVVSVSLGQQRRRRWTLPSSSSSSSSSSLPPLLLSLALLLVSSHAFLFHSSPPSPSSSLYSSRRAAAAAAAAVFPFSSSSSSSSFATRLNAVQKNESSSSSAVAAVGTTRLSAVTPLQAKASATQEAPEDIDIGLISEEGGSTEEAPVMLGTQSAAAAFAPTVDEDDPSMNPLPPAAQKKRGGGRGKRASAYADQDWSVKTQDDVCRATINVISSGDEKDLQMLTPFVERLLTRYGDHVEILHRSYVPDDKPGLRLLEIWFEGFETFRLYSRYQFTKKGKQGDLTAESIEEMCTKIDYAMYLDATGDYGPL